MRQDIQKVLCERQRSGSSEKSIKTRLKLNPNLFNSYCDDDGYDCVDADPGPIRFSSARRRQESHGVFHKRHSHNYRAMTQFLRKAVGRPWDDVFSEICQNIDQRSDIGYHFFRNLRWTVESNVIFNIEDGKPYHGCSRGRYEYNGFYIHNGILCENERPRYQRPKAPVDSIHWYGDVWFQLENLKRPAKCGCLHYKPRIDRTDPGYYWKYSNTPETCIHGNEQTTVPLWYVIKYSFHKPDEVFQVWTYEECGDQYRSRYGLKAPGDKYYIYYRDVPKKMKEPITVHKKVANKKELKLIREYLEGSNNQQVAA